MTVKSNITVFLGESMARDEAKYKDEAKRKRDSYRVQEGFLSDEDFLEIVKDACHEFAGDTTVLESAIGALAWGRVVGWHGLRVMHSSRTFKKYEEILNIKFREKLKDRTIHSTRMNGIRLADGMGKFWQVITAGQVAGKDAKEAIKVN
jgi:hypothetical protein